MKKYSVFIGRFQPVTRAHIQVIKTALEQTDECIVVLGSHNQAVTPRNPFTSAERFILIKIACEDAGIDFSRVKITAVENHSYNDNAWIKNVQDAVIQQILAKWSPDPYEIYLVGHKKDETSFYLDLFPTWKSIAVSNIDGINATDVRKIIFESMSPGLTEYFPDIDQYISPSVENWITEWMDGPVAEELRTEYVTIKAYKKSWESAPYPVIFQTTDAVVVQAGHVLMITRGAAPGKGLLALPGGFLNYNERIVDGMLRELEEETKIDVPERTLRRCIVKREVFDDPHRSQRGRTITHGFLIDLGAKGKLPKVKGSDDAVKAQWIPLTKLDGSKIFEDHLSIIKTLVGI